MHVADLLTADRIALLAEPWSGDKFELLRHALELATNSAGLDASLETIWQPLHEREESMSTGIGQAVAIPHCSTDAVSEVLAFALILKHGVDFDSIDGQPVHIVVLLVTPKSDFDRHIKVLAAVARLFNDHSNRAQFLSTGDAEAAAGLVRKLGSEV